MTDTPAEQRHRARVEHIANRVEAMRALLAGHEGAKEWLTATGLEPEDDCTCPYCATPSDA